MLCTLLVWQYTKYCPRQDILLPHITDCINSSISDGIFPDALKLADISPIFKKGNETDKVNYRPISLLPAISKVYEKIIYIQLEEFHAR